MNNLMYFLASGVMEVQSTSVIKCKSREEFNTPHQANKPTQVCIDSSFYLIYKKKVS